MGPFRVSLRIAAAAAMIAASSTRAEEVIRVSGTGTALGAMNALAAAFEKANPGLRLHILASVGSSGAIKAVADGALEVGLSGRPLRSKERALGVVAARYARTPFVFAVGARVGTTGITVADAVDIYRGETVRWQNGERVRVVLRPRSDADSDIIAAISPEMRVALDAALAREGLIMAATNQECNDILGRTPGSIGPSSLTQIMTERRPVVALAWNGVAPTLANLASGAYPLDKSLFVVVRRAPAPHVRRFLDFLASPAARKILEATGNLPVPLPAIE